MSIDTLSARIVRCRQCPRLNAWRDETARTRRASFRHETYWAKPVPGFGDPLAELLVVGLAPAAHGANRTGRMFTGDRSGEWLYRALHRAGYASQPESTAPNDGLTLQGAYVTAVVRCAPPANKPLPAERDACLPFLGQELELLRHVRAIIALGGFAWQGLFSALCQAGYPSARRPRFSHGATAETGPYLVLGSYHPSQQNTFTGRLTEPMFDEVFASARRHLMRGAR